MIPVSAFNTEGSQKSGGWGFSMYDAEHWRRRAAEMRTIADSLTALRGAKAAIVRTADEYDRRALRAERRREA